MRILYLTDQVYLAGGAEKILTQKLNYWADVLGAEVLLVTDSQLGKPSFYPISDKVRHLDLGYSDASGTLYHPKNFRRFRSEYSALKKIISEFRPHATFVVSQRVFHIITPFAAKGFPAYFEYHTSWYGFKITKARLPLAHRIKDKAIRAMLDFVESRYTNIVYLNRRELDYWKKPNGIIIPNFFDPATVPQQKERKPIVIALGRLIFQKGYDTLIDVWNQADNKISGWELHVYGDGPDREALEKKLARHDFKNPMRLLPTTREVPAKLDEASLYVMSSRTDTFPMVLLESLYHGVPVVSFDCPSGPGSILTDGSDSVIVPDQDEAALAEALVRLTGDAQLRDRMGAQARENVKRFSPERIMALLQELVLKNSGDIG